MTCDWCGHDHDQTALCPARPKWSRRGFLSVFGIGVTAAVLAPSLPSLDLMAAPPQAVPTLGMLIAQAWEDVIGGAPLEIFDRHWLLDELRTAPPERQMALRVEISRNTLPMARRVGCS